VPGDGAHRDHLLAGLALSPGRVQMGRVKPNEERKNERNMASMRSETFPRDTDDRNDMTSEASATPQGIDKDPR